MKLRRNSDGSEQVQVNLPLELLSKCAMFDLTSSDFLL